MEEVVGRDTAHWSSTVLLLEGREQKGPIRHLPEAGEVRHPG